MSEANITSYNVNKHELTRYSRSAWYAAGVDSFTQPPTQNEDALMEATNVLPPMDGVFLRRWCYRTFHPKLDTGSGDGS
jgi:hypothetical protein